MWYDIWDINYAIWTSKISPIRDIMKCTWANFEIGYAWWTSPNHSKDFKKQIITMTMQGQGTSK